MENEQSFYMGIAQVVALASRCNRSRVGAILVKEGNIIAMGYNGSPAGFDNTCEQLIEDKWVTLPHVLHAESNCLMKCARSTQSSERADLYVTVSPCLECAKLIIQAGVARVFYHEAYRETGGLDLLTKANIYHAKI